MRPRRVLIMFVFIVDSPAALRQVSNDFSCGSSLEIHLSSPFSRMAAWTLIWVEGVFLMLVLQVADVRRGVIRSSASSQQSRLLSVPAMLLNTSLGGPGGFGTGDEGCADFSRADRRVGAGVHGTGAGVASDAGTGAGAGTGVAPAAVYAGASVDAATGSGGGAVGAGDAVSDPSGELGMLVSMSSWCRCGVMLQPGDLVSSVNAWYAGMRRTMTSTNTSKTDDFPSFVKAWHTTKLNTFRSTRLSI